jgi:hypothetical protein
MDLFAFEVKTGKAQIQASSKRNKLTAYLPILSSEDETEAVSVDVFCSGHQTMKTNSRNSNTK